MQCNLMQYCSYNRMHEVVKGTGVACLTCIVATTMVVSGAHAGIRTRPSRFRCRRLLRSTHMVPAATSTHVRGTDRPTDTDTMRVSLEEPDQPCAGMYCWGGGGE